MYKNVIKDRLGMLVVNGLLALMMVFGSFGAANAQEAGNRILLPLVQAGSGVGQPVDGPFASVPELSDLSDISMPDLLAEESTESEVTAAAGCLSRLQRNARISSRAGWTGYYRHMTTRNCRDLNVKVSVSSPAQCDVYIEALYFSPSRNRWIRGSGSHRDIKANNWTTPITGLPDNILTAVRIWNNGQCGSARIQIAS